MSFPEPSAAEGEDARGICISGWPFLGVLQVPFLAGIFGWRSASAWGEPQLGADSQTRP